MTFDFRRYFSLPLSSVGESVTFGEALCLVEELFRETGSHLYAAVAGYHHYAASRADIAAVVAAEAFLNVNRDRKKQREPFDLGRPWSTDPNADVTAEQRAELRAQLERRSAFAS